MAAMLLIVSRFCLISLVLTVRFTRALQCSQDIICCTGLCYCCVNMSALIPDILKILFVIVTLIITPDMAVTYSRDRLLSLRNHTAQLNQGQRSIVSQLGLRRRGCRAGAHCQRRLQVAHSVTSSTTRTSTRGEIPTIIGHRVVFVNNNQLIDARRDGSRVTPRSCSSNQLPHQPIVSSPLCSLVSNSALSTTSACLKPEVVNAVSFLTNCNEKEKAHNGSQPAAIMLQNSSPQSVPTYISPKSLSVEPVQSTYQAKLNDTSSLFQYDSNITDFSSSSTSSDISPASIRSVLSQPSSLAETDDDDVCSVLDASLNVYSQDSNPSLPNCSSNYTWINSST